MVPGEQLEPGLDSTGKPWNRDGMDLYSATQLPLYEVKANLFKGLAHPVRVRVLEVLSSFPAVSVTDLLADTGLEASHLSQHLSVLRRHNLVVAERRASQVFYRLAYPEVADLLSVSRSLLVKILERTQQQLVSTVNHPDVPLRRDIAVAPVAG
jgi:DNA-binding transcriptional ArsR family regulator